MKKAVIYARYSSDNQTEQSIEGQIRVCNEYAERNDILIVDSYIDRAMSGTNDHRPEFQHMIKDSSKKEWDYVIVYKLDRFSRDKYETVIYRKKLYYLQYHLPQNQSYSFRQHQLVTANTKQRTALHTVYV